MRIRHWLDLTHVLDSLNLGGGPIAIGIDR